MCFGERMRPSVDENLGERLPPSRRIALVVGVSQFDAGLPELPGAGRDASALHLQLSNGRHGYHHGDVRAIPNPTCDDYKKAIDKLVGDLKGQSSAGTVVLFLATHGLNVGEEYHLCMEDSSFIDNIPQNTITFGQLRNWLEPIDSHSVVVILDSCRFRPEAQGESFRMPDVCGMFLTGENWAIWSSASEGQQAWEMDFGDGPHGIFTEVLLTELRRPGNPEQKELLITEVHERVIEGVQNTINDINKNMQQTPRLSMDFAKQPSLGLRPRGAREEEHNERPEQDGKQVVTPPKSKRVNVLLLFISMVVAVVLPSMFLVKGKAVTIKKDTRAKKSLRANHFLQMGDKEYYKLSNPEGAESFYRSACKLEKKYCHRLGYLIEHGFTKEQMPEKKRISRAKDEYNIACLHDSGRGCALLGQLQTTQKNRLLYYKKACSLKDVLGCHLLAAYYEYPGKEQSLNKSKQLLEFACKSSYTACWRLERLLRRLGADDKKKAFLLNKRACEMYQKSGQKRSFGSFCMNLAEMYLKGEETWNDEKKGIELSEKTCLWGYQKSCNSLLHHYKQRNMCAKAVAFCKKAHSQKKGSSAWNTCDTLKSFIATCKK